MKIIKIIKYYLCIIFLILLNIKKISYTKKLFIITLKNTTVFEIRNFMDMWLIGETYLNCDYEKYGIKIESNWTIIDIGAAFGDFSIFAAQKSSHNSIIAVEPLPSSLNLLRKNIKNNYLKNIIVFSGAISSTNNVLTISEDSSNYGHSQISTSSIKVQSVSLIKLFKKFNISHCHLVKCDCEGYEYDIFIKLSLDTYKKIDNIIMEYHLFNSDSSKKFKQLVSVLKNNNYCLKITPNPVHSNIGFLFASKKK